MATETPTKKLGGVAIMRRIRDNLNSQLAEMTEDEEREFWKSVRQYNEENGWSAAKRPGARRNSARGPNPATASREP